MLVGRSSGAASNQCPWTCRRHKLGVTGLAWSPDSALLASCSLDTDVLIWDAVEGHAVAVLRAHDSFVKGVAWDPVGSYVASFGEDLTVCIWSTTNWSCVAKVENGLQHMSTRALFCRCGSGPLRHVAGASAGLEHVGPASTDTASNTISDDQRLQCYREHHILHTMP